MTIVVTVSEYDGSVDDAISAFTESESRYEGFAHVYAASSLDELPHPMQITAVREWFGDGNSHAHGLMLSDDSVWTFRTDMPLQAQVDMMEEVLSDRGMDRTEILRNQESLREAYRTHE